MLYRKEYENLDSCPICEVSRYKVVDADQGDQDDQGDQQCSKNLIKGVMVSSDYSEVQETIFSSE